MQIAKEQETDLAITSMRKQLDETQIKIKEFEIRATTAEHELANTKASFEKMENLELELKLKVQMIGTLKHDIAELQSHLSEALQKLKASGATGDAVDRSVISNLLVQFLSCKNDDKRAREILKVISSFLRLSKDDQAKIGLTENQADTANSPDGKTSSDASFTDMWITFLYKEAGL